MDLKTAIEVIDNFLHDRLNDTGVSGFEGLVALLLQQATGLEFRLSSSGRQSGRDAGSEFGYANNIKVETKHYRETTKLNLRELTAEISQAAESDNDLDIWVLATSRSVDEQIASSLGEHAETYGVEVVVFDLGINGLPRLPVLMAAFPDLVIGWAKRHQLKWELEGVRSALAVIRNASDFETTKDRLFARLVGAVGYDSARRRIHGQLLTTLSDVQNARSAFRQSLGIRAPTSQIVHRTGLNKQFDAWWDVSTIPSPAVALGEEGSGKTWAVFDWVLGRVERGDMPIVLPFAAVTQDLSTFDPLDVLLSRLLARWTGVLDERRWAHRLGRWLESGPPSRPMLLLIVDGLNERADVEWRPLFSTLLSAPWRDKIAVLVTDRQYHWRTRRSTPEFAPFREILVEGYSPAELGQALSATGISPNQIPRELMPLITKPRYCRLVADHYQEMIAAADFTRERLIYLEIKDRQESKLQYPLSDERLFEIIRDLAKRARANPEVNPKDLRSLIASPGGNEANIYEEIVSGGLLVSDTRNGMTPTYRVEPTRLVFGFGMLLAKELAGQTFEDTDQVEEFVGSWFEPQPDMDRKVEICGSAMFHALFQADFPELALRGQIRYWLGLRNWTDTAQSAFSNYVLRCPKVFLEVAEAFWSSDRDSGAAQAFLGNAFIANRDDPKVQPLLVRTVERWMGFVHPLGRRFWEFDRRRKAALPAKSPDKEESVRQEIRARAGCPVVPGDIDVAGAKVTVISDGNLLRLARFGLLIMSAGNPFPFIHALARWAVASAIMGESEFTDLVSWVVHLSDLEVDTALLEEARRLLARNEATASAAARILLSTIGNQESKALIEKHDLTPTWYKERRKEHESDPCRSLFSWTESETIPCLAREDVPLHILLERAKLPIVDPSIVVPDSLVRRAKEVLSSINPAAIYAHSMHTST